MATTIYHLHTGLGGKIFDYRMHAIGTAGYNNIIRTSGKRLRFPCYAAYVYSIVCGIDRTAWVETFCVELRW